MTTLGVRGGARRALVGALSLLGSGLLVLAGSACGGAATEPTVTVAPASEAPPPPLRDCPKLSTGVVGPKSVLGETTLDPQIVKLFEAALKCDWGRMGFVYDCDGFRAYTSEWDLFRDEKGTASLLRLLEDPSEKVRTLAAIKLNYQFETDDEDDARRVIEDARREKSAMVGRDLGLVVGGIDVEATGTFAEVAALARQHELYELRVGIASRLLDKNQKSHDALRLAVDLTKDKNLEVALAAVQSLVAAKGSYKDEVCGALADVVRSNQERLVAPAVDSISEVGCPAFRDELLATIQTQLETTQYPSYWSFTRALQKTCDASDATPEQRKRSASIATHLIQNEKVFFGARIEAMKVVMACEPNEGERVIKKYKNDKEEKIREAVADLLQKHRESQKK